MVVGGLDMGTAVQNDHTAEGTAVWVQGRWDAMSYIVSEFPGAAVTNDHKRSGLKQQEYIMLQFWGAEAK